MIDQLAGAASALVVVLAYALIVECLTAAVVLLAEFIALRVRVLRSMVPPKRSQTAVAPTREPEPAQPQDQVILGGGIRRWSDAPIQNRPCKAP